MEKYNRFIVKRERVVQLLGHGCSHANPSRDGKTGGAHASTQGQIKFAQRAGVGQQAVSRCPDAHNGQASDGLLTATHIAGRQRQAAAIVIAAVVAACRQTKHNRGKGYVQETSHRFSDLDRNLLAGYSRRQFVGWAWRIQGVGIIGDFLANLIVVAVVAVTDDELTQETREEQLSAQ